MAILACKYASTALNSCYLTSLSYNLVASVLEEVNNDKTERLFIGKQLGDTGEVEKVTEVKVAILAS